MITIDEYKKAQEELSKIKDEDDKQNKVLDAEHNAVFNKFWDQEQEVSRKKRIAERALQKKRDIHREKIQNREKLHVEKIQAYKRILTFMEISKDGQDTNFEVCKFDYPRDEKGEVIRVLEGNCWCYPERIEIPYESLATLKNDKYAKIQAFIVENNKPKNKYSLIIVGKSIFREKLFSNKLDYPYWYGLRCRTSCNNIAVGVKDRPTKEELVAYFEKNRDKMLKDYFEEHQQIEKEYEEIIEQTANRRWELAYWEDKKDYYENHYVNGTETKEYKAVLKKLKALTSKSN